MKPLSTFFYACILTILLFAPLPALAIPGFLCSDGPFDREECDFDSDCTDDPGVVKGACLAAQFICDGGSRDSFNCDCPGGTCQSGQCNGGLFEGEGCDRDFDCDAGTCRETARVCSGGEDEGFACLSSSQCRDGDCIANGLLCWGGIFFKFGCVDSFDCVLEGEESGECRAPAVPQVTPLLCSAGSGDGMMCEADENCPDGACVVAQNICDEGPTTDAFFCESETDCDPGSACLATQKICAFGDDKGFGCLRDETCPDSLCVATARYCDGGDFSDFSCVDADDCSGGECVSPIEPTCAGDCNSDESTTEAEIAAGVEVILLRADASTCAHLASGTPSVADSVRAVRASFSLCP